MLYYLHLLLLAPFYSLVSIFLRRDQDREILLLRQQLRPPQDHRRSPTWSQFLGQSKDFIWACDFFTVTTARLRTFYVLFFMELGRRRLLWFNVMEHPQAEWVVQQVRNLSVAHDHLPRFILHDRDGKFSEEFDTCAEGSGAKIIKLPARSPISTPTRNAGCAAYEKNA